MVKGEQSGSTSSFSTTKRPCFYKLMDGPSTKNCNLIIPETYVKTYGERFVKDDVELRVAGSAHVRRVDLLKENGTISLTKGWEVLIRDYCVKYGYMILFRYDEGSSKFHLNIFDMTRCEIDYEAVYNDHNKVEPGVIILSDDDGVYENPTIIKETPQANNPSFVVEMYATHVSKRCRLSFPMNHVSCYLSIEPNQNLILIGPDERKYPIKLNVYASRSQAEAQAGWRNFVIGNELKEGDTCIFELVNPLKKTYKISVSRAT